MDELQQKSGDASPAARSSDNEADVSGESASNSLERPSSRPVSLNNLHGLQEVSILATHCVGVIGDGNCCIHAAT